MFDFNQLSVLASDLNNKSMAVDAGNQNLATVTATIGQDQATYAGNVASLNNDVAAIQAAPTPANPINGTQLNADVAQVETEGAIVVNDQANVDAANNQLNSARQDYTNSWNAINAFIATLQNPG